MPAKNLLGKDVQTFGTIFEWREEPLPEPYSNGWYTALIDLVPEASFPGGINKAVEASAFSALLLADGTVFTWGQQSGPPREENNQPLPAETRAFLEGFTNVRQITASELAVAVLLNDGSVEQFELETPDANPLPPPADLSGVVQIAMGLRHIVALRADGTVTNWGAIANGIEGPAELFSELPVYTYAQADTLLPDGLTNVVQVAAAFHHAFALKSDGTVVGWGYRSGDPWQLLPAYVPAGLTNVVQIATSEAITAALRSDGTVSVWAFTNSIPAEYGFILPPANLTNVVKVAVGNGHGMALINDGTVRSWGRYAMPRDGAANESPDPLMNSMPADSSTWTNIIDISAGNESGYGLVWDGSSGLPPVVTRVVRGSENFVLEWSDSLSRPVNVQRRTSLSSGSWSNISTNVMATKFTDTNPPTTAAFYRLVVP
jgi:alpha-tubulin suppressor-like RCC1 family protein